MEYDIHKLLTEAVQSLQNAGVDTGKEDAKILMAEVLGIKRQEVPLYRKPLSEKQRDLFLQYIKQRIERKPVSRILGTRGFRRLDFILNEDTLDPRPDSETLVEAVLQNTRCDSFFNILDLGTGTGCLLLSVLFERPKAFGVGVDVAANAVKAAEENAKNCGLNKKVDFVNLDWSIFADKVEEPFDIVISNPPYIPSGDIDGLEDEVRIYDPLRALDGGEDGMSCYRQISSFLDKIMAEGGSFFCEIGKNQTGCVQKIFTSKGFEVVEKYSDFSGIERVLHIRKKKK